MKSFFFLVLALIPALFISCNRENSDTVQQDLIYQTYTLVYNGSEDKTYARASYRFSNGLGTLLFLSGGATVQFNGQPMDWKNLLAYYELEFPGNLSAGVFEYSDADGNLFTNPISQVDSIAFPATFYQPNSKYGGSYTLNWVGPVLMNGHDVLGDHRRDLSKRPSIVHGHQPRRQHGRSRGHTKSMRLGPGTG